MEKISIKERKINLKKLKDYGFKKNAESYIYATNIADNEFKLIIEAQKNQLLTKIVEISTMEEYTLHLSNATGDFVGKIREEYYQVLNEIKKNCFDMNVFKSSQSQKIIEYIEKKYEDVPEYLWEKFPRNAVFRRKDNKKWYAAILSTQKKKFYGNSNDIVELIDLRAVKDDVEVLIKMPQIYPAYHMNKKNWITLLLDNSVSEKEIFEFIDKSYKLARKK